jgi:hypothetical protein
VVVRQACEFMIGALAIFCHIWTVSLALGSFHGGTCRSVWVRLPRSCIVRARSHDAPRHLVGAPLRVRRVNGHNKPKESRYLSSNLVLEWHRFCSLRPYSDYLS